MRSLEVGIIVFSVASCCFSLVVIVTILFFRRMTRGRLMPIILYMSLSDFFMNIASAFGFPSNGTVLCWAQGLLQGYFALSSWFWTTLLAYRVFCGVRYGTCSLSPMKMHLIGWCLPLLLTLIPLSTMDIGHSHSQWCVYAHRRGDAQWLLPFWSFAFYFAWLFICVLLMLTWQVMVSIQYRNSHMRAVVSKTYDKVYLYPVAMIVCWTLNFWCDRLSPHSGTDLNVTGMIFGISNGIFAAIIFMTKSEEARKRWIAYLFPGSVSSKSGGDEGVDPNIPLDFEEDDLEYADSSNATGQFSMSSIGRDSAGGIGQQWDDSSTAATATTTAAVVVGNNPLHR